MRWNSPRFGIQSLYLVYMHTIHQSFFVTAAETKLVCTNHNASYSNEGV
jgi:hypothetical protein